MDVDDDLFSIVHKSRKFQWLGAQDQNSSSLVGKRADLCVRQREYVPGAQPNVRGFITAWSPVCQEDGSAKWCWHGESGDQFVLRGEDAYRAVRVAEVNVDIELIDVLRARSKLSDESRKKQKMLQAETMSQAITPWNGNNCVNL
jgi:hypothetical protein